METQLDVLAPDEPLVSVEDVQRLLELGSLLLQVLSLEELEDLQILLSAENQIRNTGDS